MKIINLFDYPSGEIVYPITTSDAVTFEGGGTLTEKLEEKLDVLTAGTNITIENNVISASGGGGDSTPHILPLGPSRSRLISGDVGGTLEEVLDDLKGDGDYNWTEDILYNIGDFELNKVTAVIVVNGDSQEVYHLLRYSKQANITMVKYSSDGGANYVEFEVDHSEDNYSVTLVEEG